MRVAVVYRLPIGPIQASLTIAAKEKGFDVLEMPKGKEGVPPAGKSWDDYDTLIWFHNQPPTIQTSAKVLWWMCDLRDPSTISNVTTASEVFVCNLLFKDDYSEHFGIPSYHLPQCGNDVPVTDGRKLKEDVLFLGLVRNGRPWEVSNPVNRDKLRALIRDRAFHGNRAPVVDEIQKDRAVKVISREGLTKDQKYLYANAPVSLSVSLPAKGYSSNRLYNILSSGGFALVNWFPGIAYQFENGQHLAWFKTPEEARELANFYMANPNERNRIAVQGRNLYLSRDTAGHRLDYMLETL